MSGFGFAAPWMLLAGLALAVPIVAHLARHEDREGRGFPSLMFLRQVPFPSRSRRTVTDRWLLALRLLALLALVLAFARPWFTLAGAAPGTPERVRVVLLDRSWSMAGGDRFEQARRIAAQALSVDRDTRVALLAFDETVQILSDFDDEPGHGLQALRVAEVGNRATDVGKAFAQAARMLVAREANAREVVLIGDLQASGLGSVLSLPADIVLQVHAVRSTQAGNTALLDAWHGPAAQAGAAHALHVRVLNTGESAVSTTLRVMIDGLRAADSPISLSAHERRVIEVPIVAAHDRPMRVRLALDDDTNNADNSRQLVVAALRPVNVLMVHAVRADTVVDARAFVDAAVAASQQSASGSAPAARVRHIDVPTLDPEALDDADVIVLDGVLPGTPALARALDQAVAGGKGLLVLAGDKGFGDATLDPALSKAVAALPAAGNATLAGATALGALSAEHAIRATLGGAGLEGIPVWTHRALAPTSADRVVLQFADGTAAWVERAHGAGRSMTWAFALHPRSSDLVLEPVFVPLLLESLRYLAQRRSVALHYTPGAVFDAHAYADALFGGEAITTVLRAGEDLAVRAPSGQVLPLAREQRAAFDELGFYELRARGASPLPVAVNVAPAEITADLLSVDEFRARVSREVSLLQATRADDDAAAMRDFGLGYALLLLAVGAFLAEALLAHLLTRRRLVVGGAR